MIVIDGVYESVCVCDSVVVRKGEGVRVWWSLSLSLSLSVCVFVCFFVRACIHFTSLESEMNELTQISQKLDCLPVRH